MGSFSCSMWIPWLGIHLGPLHLKFQGCPSGGNWGSAFFLASTQKCASSPDCFCCPPTCLALFGCISLTSGFGTTPSCGWTPPYCCVWLPCVPWAPALCLSCPLVYFWLPSCVPSSQPLLSFLSLRVYSSTWQSVLNALSGCYKQDSQFTIGLIFNPSGIWFCVWRG